MKSKVIKPRGFIICNDVHSCIILYMNDVEKLAYLLFMGVFIKNIKFKSNQKSIYNQNVFFLSPIVRSIIPNNTIYKSHMYMYIIVSYMLSRVIDKTKIVLGGSWCLKLYELQSDIYRFWTPSDINFYSSEKMFRKNKIKLSSMPITDNLSIDISNNVVRDNEYNRYIKSYYTFNLLDKMNFHTYINITTYYDNDSIEKNIFSRSDINLNKCYFDGLNFHMIDKFKEEMVNGYLNYTILCNCNIKNIISSECQSIISERLKKYNRYNLRSIKCFDNNKIELLDEKNDYLMNLLSNI